MVEHARAEDAPERAGVLEERRHEHQQRRVHEERLEALLDGEARDHVDGAGEDEDGQRLARDASQDRVLRADAGEQRDERDGATEDGDDHREPGDADQVGGDEERGQRDHVAGRGDDRRGHVVEVPVAPDAELGDDHGDAHHHHRRQDAADHRDHHEVGDRDRVLQAERHADGLGQEREHQRHRQRHRHRGREVLPDERVAPARHAEGTGVDRSAEAAPQRAEHVAAHADGGRDEDEEAGKGFERAGDRAERQPGNQVTARAEQERVEARSDPGGVRAQQRAEAREDGSPRLQHGYSEARSFPRSWTQQGYSPSGGRPRAGAAQNPARWNVSVPDAAALLGSNGPRRDLSTAAPASADRSSADRLRDRVQHQSGEPTDDRAVDADVLQVGPQQELQLVRGALRIPREIVPVTSASTSFPKRAIARSTSASTESSMRAWSSGSSRTRAAPSVTASTRRCSSREPGCARRRGDRRPRP